MLLMATSRRRLGHHSEALQIEDQVDPLHALDDRESASGVLHSGEVKVPGREFTAVQARVVGPCDLKEQGCSVRRHGWPDGNSVVGRGDIVVDLDSPSSARPGCPRRC